MGKRDSDFLGARGECYRLCMTEIGPVHEVRSGLGIGDRDQAVEELGRQAGVGSKSGQNMVHGPILPGTSSDDSRIFRPGDEARENVCAAAD